MEPANPTYANENKMERIQIQICMYACLSEFPYVYISAREHERNNAHNCLLSKGGKWGQNTQGMKTNQYIWVFCARLCMCKYTYTYITILHMSLNICMCYVSVYMKTQVAVYSEMLQPFIRRSTNL